MAFEHNLGGQKMVVGSSGDLERKSIEVVSSVSKSWSSLLGRPFGISGRPDLNRVSVASVE